MKNERERRQVDVHLGFKAERLDVLFCPMAGCIPGFYVDIFRRFVWYIPCGTFLGVYQIPAPFMDLFHG
jgi:hypothetical protein